MRRAETRSRRVRASRRESSTGSAAEFAELQRETFGYFLHEANPGNGLIPDNTRYGAACSIAAVGLAMACYPVAARRGIGRCTRMAGSLTGGTPSGGSFHTRGAGTTRL